MTANHQSDSILRIETIGRFAIVYGERPIAVASRQAKALLAYLVFADQLRESRRRLVAMFRRETETQREAQNSLRRGINLLRMGFRRARCGVLGIDVRGMSLDPGRVRVDILDLVRSLEAGRLPERLRALTEFDKAFLQELDGIDPELDTWLHAQRRTLGDRIRRALERLIADPLRAEDHADAARALLMLDPTHEEAERALARLGAETGDGPQGWHSARSAAVLGQLPFGHRAGLRQLGSHEGEPLRRPSNVVRLTPRAQRLVVTVAPFEAESVSRDRQYLCNGFRRELIASLNHFREWVVRDGVQPLAGRPGGDEYLLEAHASENAGRLRIVFTMKEGGADDYVWSERISLSLDGWTAAHQHIVRQLAGSLNVSISEGRLRRVVPERSGGAPAFDRWLQGQALILSFSRDDWHAARALFEEVIETTPDFGPAYSSRAQLENIIHISHYGCMRSSEAENRALKYARRATELDRADSRAQLALAWSHLMLEQFDLATRHYDLAVRLNESDGWTLTSSALGLAFSGDHERAGRLADRALELGIVANRAQWGYLMRVRYLAGDLERALEARKDAGAAIAAPGWVCAILAQSGRIEEAAHELQRFHAAARDNWAGPAPWSERETIRWFLHCFPLRRRADWTRLRDGLALAGAPVDGLRYGYWRR